jgi:hypothetical protein
MEGGGGSTISDTKLKNVCENENFLSHKFLLCVCLKCRLKGIKCTLNINGNEKRKKKIVLTSVCGKMESF